MWVPVCKTKVERSGMTSCNGFHLIQSALPKIGEKKKTKRVSLESRIYLYNV